MPRIIAGWLLAGALLWSTGGANALPITGGETTIKFTDEIQKLVVDDLGATVSAYGSAGYDPATAVATFPVTGGNSASGGLPGSLIEHGGGLRITAGDTLFEFGDFVVDVDTGIVISSVRSENPAVDTPLDVPAGAAFFVGPNPEPGHPFALTLTPNSVRNFNNTFGGDALVADQLAGTADIELEVVPIPAALPLLLTSVGALGLVARWRRRRAA